MTLQHEAATAQTPVNINSTRQTKKTRRATTEVEAQRQPASSPRRATHTRASTLEYAHTRRRQSETAACPCQIALRSRRRSSRPAALRDLCERACYAFRARPTPPGEVPQRAGPRLSCANLRIPDQANSARRSAATRRAALLVGESLAPRDRRDAGRVAGPAARRVNSRCTSASRRRAQPP